MGDGTPLMDDSGAPKLLILNQMAGPMTCELAEDMGSRVGRVELLTGHPDALARGSTEAVRLHPAMPYERGSNAQRALSWLRYVIRAFFWLWRWPKNVLLLLYSNPPILCWLGLVMRLLRGQRYAVMVYDVYPDVVVNLGHLSAEHPVARLWRWLNRQAYERAEVVLTLGEHLAASVEKQFDAAKTGRGRIEIVSPWADTERIHPIPKEMNWFAQKYDQVGKLTLMYSGNMGRGHDIETMLAAAQASQDRPDIHYVFIGHGPKWRLVEETIQQGGLTNVTLLPWQPEDVVPYSLATADVFMVSLEKGLEGTAIPSKAVYGMAAGSALLVLARGGTELKSWIERHQCGVLMAPGSVEEFREAVQRFVEDRELLQQYKRNARAAAVLEFDRQTNIRRFREVLGLGADS